MNFRDITNIWLKNGSEEAVCGHLSFYPYHMFSRNHVTTSKGKLDDQNHVTAFKGELDDLRHSSTTSAAIKQIQY